MLDYKLQEFIKRQDNIKELRMAISENNLKDYSDKIRKFAKRFDLEIELVKYKLLTDDLFVYGFIKDPTKQSFHQNLASDYIRNLPNVYDFIALPNKDAGSLYVINGMVVDHTQQANSSVSVKSIDFQWNYLNSKGVYVQCYASHKYTAEGGGAQDNQYKDLKSFLDHARNHKSNYFFYAMCDGDYYLAPIKKNGSTNKIDHLNVNHVGPRCFALTINDLEDHMLNNL